MTTVIVVCEGQTEETFVRDVLAPHLWQLNVFLDARLVGRRGGNLAWDRVQLFLRNTIRERNDTFVTTMFDLYALDDDFPGSEGARATNDPLARASAIERATSAAIVEIAGCRIDRFFAYLQPYEYEALLFTDPDLIAQRRSEWNGHAAALKAARASAITPEHIDDGPTTHPSARLDPLSPRFVKPFDGPALAEQIGIDRI